MTIQDKGHAWPLRLIPRRQFLRDSALVAGTAGTLTLGADRASAQNATPQASPVATAPTLTEAGILTLQAVVNRIFPADEYGPSGVECGVDVYMQSSLAGWQAATVPLYTAGLAALDAAAGAGGFGALDAAAQDELLVQLEAGTLADAPEGFWGLILEHARQGMFSDPIYGGNKDFAGWDLINYPGIKLIWTPEDQAVDTEIEPEHISVAQYQGDE